MMLAYLFGVITIPALWGVGKILVAGINGIQTGHIPLGWKTVMIRQDKMDGARLLCRDVGWPMQFDIPLGCWHLVRVRRSGVTTAIQRRIREILKPQEGGFTDGDL